MPAHSRCGSLRSIACVLVAVGVCSPALAYESDVHYGLTKWLALRAGFDDSQSTSIALGNQRVDGGMMETLALSLEYGCTSPDPVVAREVQQRHFPAAVSVPAPASERAVEAGGAAARRPLAELAPKLRGREGLMLGKFGEALHPLQDSWAHQGVPAIAPVPGITCDATLLSGMATTHNGELTRSSPQAMLAMARATYEALTAYPPVQGKARTAAAWDQLVPEATAFAMLPTKAAKRDWFRKGGVRDVSFLDGTSLPDGPLGERLAWDERKLPSLPRDTSIQHDAPADAREFVDALLARWLGGGAIEAAQAVEGKGATTKAQRTHPPRELLARWKLWRWRDHGSATQLLHARAALNAAQVAAADRLTRDPKGAVTGPVTDAVLPLQPLQPPAAPLVPYVLRSLPEVGGQPLRMVAMMRLRHAPYDTVGWVIAREPHGWTLVDIVSVVDR